MMTKMISRITGRPRALARGIGLVAGLVLLAGAPAMAQQSETLFSHKHWKVDLVAWDDGGMGCVAEVSAPGESFSLWTFQDGSIQLQFYSTGWNFGEGETADLQVQIDKRASWNLTNAELYKNSVLFNLPGSDDGFEFVLEVAQGSRLYLRDKDGAAVKDYSLAGSKASIDALVACGGAITQKSSSNPFK